MGIGPYPGADEFERNGEWNVPSEASRTAPETWTAPGVAFGNARLAAAPLPTPQVTQFRSHALALAQYVQQHVPNDGRLHRRQYVLIGRTLAKMLEDLEEMPEMPIPVDAPAVTDVA